MPTLEMTRPAAPRSRVGQWFLKGAPGETQHESRHPWKQVLWLTGVDYFSTLGYQPGIALLAAGALSPIATVLLLVVTLLGALPTYSQVAARSYAGQGSIAMLEELLPGWVGKATVLGLLGFAATDFVITVTLSAADAAQHAIENPLLHPYLHGHAMAVTLALMAVLTVVFLRGFREAIGIATLVGVPYLALNLVVVGRAAFEIVLHPELFSNWSLSVAAHGDWTAILIFAGLTFPRLALGMSGFETGVTVMPLIDGGDGERTAVGKAPLGRIQATRKLLTTAAFVMSFYLLATSLVTTLLIPHADYAEGGPAAGRAIAYLAHGYLGHIFGSIYDASTIAILWFAGASATAGLLHLVPRYLPRFGMAPTWVQHMRPLVLIFFGIEILVTLAFQANVEAQAGAYATGVLVLMLSAAIAVTLAIFADAKVALVRKSFGKMILGTAHAAYFALVSLVFVYTLLDNVHARPDGLIVASIFIASILLLSALSRTVRATELRVAAIGFEDPESERLWTDIAGKKVNLIPFSGADAVDREFKRAKICGYYSVRGPLAFLQVHLVDDRSEFTAKLRVRVRRVNDDYVVDVFGAVAIANTIAYVSELLDPISVFLALGRRNLMRQAVGYLFWGEGEVGLLVYTILLRHWQNTPEDDVRPLIFLMSE